MQCVKPISIRNPANFSGVTISYDRDLPYIVETGESPEPRILVPCGKCVVCQENRRNAWAARLELEARTSACSFFATLTYNDESRPGELRIEHLQKFIKRARKSVPFRFFACGEYGDQFGREHFHIALFFADKHEFGEIYALLNDKWRLGFVKLDSLTWNRCRYVAKYTIKQLFSVPEGKTPPFAVMSRRPGIGYDFFAGTGQYCHDYLVLENGQHQALPRYFLNKLDPVEAIAVKRHCREYAEGLPKISETEKQLRNLNLERSLKRKYIFKYGRAETRESACGA